MTRKRRGRMVGSRLDHALNRQAQRIFRERYEGQPVRIVVESELGSAVEHTRGEHEGSPDATAATG